MALEKVNHILQHATQNKYGVAAINTFNFETIQSTVAAAEAERVPIIIQMYPGLGNYIPLEYIAHMACAEAVKASVPVAVHLDHSATCEIAIAGIRDGFPSVMIDGSAQEYETNVEMTAAVVNTARVFGVDVEAELGHVGSGSNVDDIVNSDHYTDVEQAVDFIQRTGCGSLAIAVGNAHGPYIQTPKLDFDRIRAIRAKIAVPLVLHGCSDIPDEQIQESVNQGMSKFNIATEYFRAYYNALAKGVEGGAHKQDSIGLSQEAREEMTRFVRTKIKLLNPNGFSL